METAAADNTMLDNARLAASGKIKRNDTNYKKRRDKNFHKIRNIEDRSFFAQRFVPKSKLLHFQQRLSAAGLVADVCAQGCMIYNMMNTQHTHGITTTPG